MAHVVCVWWRGTLYNDPLKLFILPENLGHHMPRGRATYVNLECISTTLNNRYKNMYGSFCNFATRHSDD
jgi:hypothetical protein